MSGKLLKHGFNNVIEHNSEQISNTFEILIIFRLWFNFLVLEGTTQNPGFILYVLIWFTEGEC